jgi:hypothetical protein
LRDAGEKIMTRMGGMTAKGGAHKRKDMAAMLTEGSVPQATWPDWLLVGMEKMRIAPSAVNKQPWAFTVARDGDRWVISILETPGGYAIGTLKFAALDTGIAASHLALALHARHPDVSVEETDGHAVWTLSVTD